MKIAFVLGTRPEIIKFSPVIRECEGRGLDYFILHTNQHYSPELDKVFFDELKLPPPKFNLGVSQESRHGAMVGKMLIGIEQILLKQKPDWVLVQGDTNTALAGALAGSKLGIKLGHVEAGLRSYDRTMPEELNRIIADHLSDLLFCPTDHAAKIAKGEGIPFEQVVTTGNTIVDATMQNLPLANSAKLPIALPASYFLLTLHRPANVDTKKALQAIISGLESLAKKHQTPILFPAHPRTKKQLTHYKLDPDPQHIKLVAPVGYLSMLKLEQSARLILTDSGGMQEEACILRVPCVTLRDNTERPETVEVGANLLAGTKEFGILTAGAKMLAAKRTWSNPFGKGRAAANILNSLLTHA